MEIITADLDWTSIAIFIIAGIISVVKYFNKQPESSEPVFPEGQDEKEEERSIVFPVDETFVHQATKEDSAVSLDNEVVAVREYEQESVSTYEFNEEGASIRKSNEEDTPSQEKPSVKNQTEQTFDLRQAVIGNIILNRPEF